MGAEEEFMEISRDIEKAWRIVTRPQEYSRYRVRKAEDLLDDTKLKILVSIDMKSTDEEIAVCEDLMLGFYHYTGARFFPGFLGEPNLN